MKARLEFDLEEPSDRVKHLQCTKAADMHCALHAFLEQLRRQIKDSDDAREAATLRTCRELLDGELEARGVDLEDLTEK